MTHDSAKFLEAAWQAASAAGEIIRASWHQRRSIDYKARLIWPPPSTSKASSKCCGVSFRNIRGKEFSVRGNETVASNGIIHPEMGSAIKTVASARVD
jgi:hypothetical protein